jgi:hypothetical protein
MRFAPHRRTKTFPASIGSFVCGALRVDQQEVQAALSALPLFYDLFGFRFRVLKYPDWHGLKF